MGAKLPSGIKVMVKLADYRPPSGKSGKPNLDKASKRALTEQQRKDRDEALKRLNAKSPLSAVDPMLLLASASAPPSQYRCSQR